MITFLNRLISFSFYALFFFVPLVFTSDTSELFEFNKMWLTFGLTIIISASWLTKMLLTKKIIFKRTILDIPIGLFLISQIISTFMSLDVHTSIWGYYSRFNGGLLSLVSFALFYFAFVANISKKQAIRYLLTMVVSALFVSLWGIPSHFGYDPTCLVFRGTFDVSCWTNAFQPKVRIFSTLGQPDWLSAYLAAIIPIATSLALYFWAKSKKATSIFFFIATFLCFPAFLWAKSRAGFAGISISLFLLFIYFFWQEKKKQLLPRAVLIVPIIFLVIATFCIGTSFDQVDKFSLPTLLTKLQSQPAETSVKTPASAPQATDQELGGTDSGKIRLLVWSGALQAWMHYPIFGTGVETFAYAYYLYMPPGQNMTSEFGYLYNKAHNEYLNFLTTTGIVGLGTYLVMLSFAIWVMGKPLLQKKDTQKAARVTFLTAGILAGYLSILISNFFGFSVVIINIFLFLFPGFVILLQEEDPKEENREIIAASSIQWIASGIIALLAVYFLYVLFVYWQADKAYALGMNLVNIGDYQSAYQPLHEAAEERDEPVFLDELSYDDAVLAAALVQQNKNNATTANQLAQEAITVSNNLTTNYPNVVTYWKTRVRIMYTLAALNPQYMADALIAIQKAATLAPTDAKVSYNLGLIEGQTGNVAGAITTLQNTIHLKSDYIDAYYALGIFYHSAGIDKNGNITNPTDVQKGIDEMHYILTHFNAKDTQAIAALKAWNAPVQ